MCRITVVMPTYNRARLLGRSLGSVLGQTFTDFEVIVVDDHSTDDTERVVMSFGDSRVRYMGNARAKGASGARNTGILAARADWIAFQDSDDEWRPDKLRIQAERMEAADERTGVIYSRFEYRTDDGLQCIPDESVQVREGDVQEQLLRGNFITLQASLIRKRCFEVTGLLDEALPCRHDWDLFIRLAGDWRFAFVEEPLVRVYATAESISGTHRVAIAGWRPVVEKHWSLFARHPRILAEHLYRIGSAYDLERPDERRQAQRLFLQAVRRCPRVPAHYRPAVAAALAGPRMYAAWRRLKRRFAAGKEAGESS